MLDINQYKPRREGKHKEFRSSENNCVHIGQNPNGSDIRQFKVDGEVIAAGTPGLRCDYLLLNDTGKRAYYIELKGSDLERAIDQIEATISLIGPSIPIYKVFRRIVYHTGSHKIRTAKVAKWKAKHKTTAMIQSRQIKEVI